MPYTNDNFVYAHMPKTGGTWLGGVLQKTSPTTFKQIGTGHQPLTTVPSEIRGNRTVVATIRNPWDWYVSWYVHMVTAGKVPVGVGPSFRDVLYTMTQGGADCVKDIPEQLGVVWNLPAGSKAAWLQSGVGFYSWMVDHVYDAPVDVYIDVVWLREGASKLLGRQLGYKDYPAVNVGTKQQVVKGGSASTIQWTSEMVEWVATGEAAVINRFGYEPFSAFNKSQAVTNSLLAVDLSATRRKAS